MPINVLCPTCHARFQVSEKFAGRKGPCPKCKGEITIPKANEQIKIHERDHEGVKDSKGKLVLKPIGRDERKVRPLVAAGVVAAVAVVVAAATMMRGTYASTGDATILLALGAVLLAPPLAYAGYGFLRNDELEPYRGMELVTRIAICSAVYALLWGVYWLIPIEITVDEMDWVSMLFVVPPILVVGAGAALAALDLEIGSAFFHYSLYVLVCVGLRVLMGLPAM